MTPASPRLTRARYVEGVRAGDRVILGRAITLVESKREADQELAREVIGDCLPYTGNSIRLGITGSPGVGKSTFIEALGTHLTRDLGKRVAVLAIDPSSRLSGGSILGDKTRMASLAANDRAFIRPSPSSGTLGGVAQRTREAMLLCEAAGYTDIIVETVGTGQSETAVSGMVDFFLLLTITGAGDELQGVKRGVMEMADLIAVNKADGDNRARAEQTRSQLASALHLFPASPSGWTPQAVVCSGLERTGITEIWAAVQCQQAHLKTTGWRERRRQQQAKDWMYEIIEQELLQRFHASDAVRAHLPQLESEVMAGRISSFEAAHRLLNVATFP